MEQQNNNTKYVPTSNISILNQHKIFDSYEGSSSSLAQTPQFYLTNTQRKPKRIVLKKDFGIPDSFILKECLCYYNHPKSTFEGKILLSENYISFISNSIARVVKISLPFREIMKIEKGNKALVLPNLIRIFVSNKEYNFTFSWQRDEIYLIMVRLWQRAMLIYTHGQKFASALEFAGENIDFVIQKMKSENINLQREENVGGIKLSQSESVIEHCICSLEADNTSTSIKVYISVEYLYLQKQTSCHTVSFKDIYLIELSNSNPTIIVFTKAKKYILSGITNRKYIYDLLVILWKLQHLGQDGFFDLNYLPPTLEKKFKPEDDDETDSSPVFNRNQTSFMSSLNLTYDDIPEGVFLDEYGFVVPQNLIKDYTIAKKDFQRNLTKQRTNWNTFVANNNVDHHINNKTPALMKAIRKGIPYDSRAYMWFKLSGAKEKIQSTENYSTTYYSNLASVKPFCYSDIQKDLIRTFPHHPYFKKEENILKLERVLCAYANRNPSLGYCQSMNFLCGILLLFLSEENAFWVLCTIAEERLSDYYSSWMIGSMVDLKVFEDILGEKTPRLMSYIEEKAFPLSVISTKWFMCLFIGCFPTETMLRVWDLFFLVGSPIIFAVAISLMKKYEEELLSISDTGDFITRISNLGKNWFNANNLIKFAFKIIGIMEIKQLNTYRTKFWKTVEDQLTEENRRRDINLLLKYPYFTREELDVFHSKFLKAKKAASITMNKFCARHIAIGIDYFTFEEFVKELSPQWNINEATNLLHRFFRALDKNRDLVINFRELMLGLGKMFRSTEDDRLQFFFDMYARDGAMVGEDYYHLVECLYYIYYPGDDISFNEIRSLLKDSEKISYDRFRELFLSNPKLVAPFLTLSWQKGLSGSLPARRDKRSLSELPIIGASSWQKL